MTILTGEIPPELKEAKVTPIFKNGKRTEESNYRPISVLPLVSKVMERAIQVQPMKRGGVAINNTIFLIGGDGCNSFNLTTAFICD